MDYQEILKILQLPEAEFRQTIMPLARQQYRQTDNRLYGTAMLGYTNICRNQCLYCGMRAGNSVPRFRIEPEDVVHSVALAHERGFHRVFLVAGEDPGYGFDRLLDMVAALRTLGVRISLACGEYSLSQYQELHDAGAEEYVVKFEMSQPQTFNRLNPSTDFARRRTAMEAVKQSGMDLASGNIIDYPGQTDEMIAEDILLMQELAISWAPVVPYLPAAGTPLAQEGGKPGDRVKALKEIAILRLALPQVRITAQQPGDDLTRGLADPAGNLDALNAGANLLFCDLLPEAQARAFRVVDYRELKNEDHLRRMAAQSGMTLDL